MCCAHSYDMRLCPIISGRRLETGVEQKSDRGWTEVGQRSGEGIRSKPEKKGIRDI